MLLLLHPLGVVFNLVGPEDQLVWAAVKLVGNHLLEMLADPEGNTRLERFRESNASPHFCRSRGEERDDFSESNTVLIHCTIAAFFCHFF